MALSSTALLVKDALLELNWHPTVAENIIEKNNCFLHLDGQTSEIKRFAFEYSRDDASNLQKADFNNDNAVMQTQRRLLRSICNVTGQHYYLEKYGWLLAKGKYSSKFNTLTKNDLIEHEDFESVQSFKDFVKSLDNAANRDHVALRGIKQHLVKREKAETVFKASIISSPITEGAFIEIQEDSISCDIFKKGSVFKIALILDSAVYVSAVNKKGKVTNKNYEIAAQVFLNEAVSHNIRVVELLPDTEMVTFDSWENFSETDIASELPAELEELITSDKQKENVMIAYSSFSNYSILLNDNITEEAYAPLLELLKLGYGTEKLFNMRIRAAEMAVWLHYASLGLDPSRFYDDSYDSFALEEDMSIAMQAAQSYSKYISAKEVNKEVCDFLYKYHFKTGNEFPVYCDSSTRWQFLLPYLFPDLFSEEQMSSMMNVIKLYGNILDNSCYLKVDFFDASCKGAILRYFKAPVDFDFLGEPWSCFLERIINTPIHIQFDEKGIYLKGSVYSIGRDFSSIYVLSVTGRVVWRCVFINEKAIINYDSNTNIYF